MEKKHTLFWLAVGAQSLVHFQGKWIQVKLSTSREFVETISLTFHPGKWRSSEKWSLTAQAANRTLTQSRSLRAGWKSSPTATTKQLAMNLVPHTLLRVVWKCFLWHRWFSYRPWCEFLRHNISQLMHQADDATQRQNGLKLYFSNTRTCAAVSSPCCLYNVTLRNLRP